MTEYRKLVWQIGGHQGEGINVALSLSCGPIVYTVFFLYTF